jgi:hypothetical protein
MVTIEQFLRRQTMKPAKVEIPAGRQWKCVATWLVFAVLLLAAGLPAAHGQLDTGSISGVVSDPSGKLVAKASVTATESTTGNRYSTTTSNTGNYVFPSVRTGRYEIKVNVPGFKIAIYSGVSVSVGSSTTQDVALAIGSASEVVSVSASGVMLERETSEVDATISPEQVQELPLQVSGNLRSLSTFEFLVPGAVGPGTSAGGAAGQELYKINGGQEEGTDNLVDGITTNRMENGSGSFDIVAPSIEAVNEFHVSLSGLPAELGRTTGGLANFNTKSGTNDYHGAVFDIYKNAALDANNWFNNGYLAETPESDVAARDSLQRPADTKNDYGVTLGGPVRIPHVYNGTDKTFFFFAWEQLRYSTGSAITSLIPTPAELGSNGQYFDFSSFLGGQITNPDGTSATDACNTALYNGEIFDPQSETNQCRTTPFPNNHIPLDRASKVAQAVIKYIPAPNLSGSGTNNYVQDTTDTLTQTVYSVRIDQNIGPNHKVWGFFSSRENSDQGNDLNLPEPITSSGGGQVNQLGKLFRTGWDWIATPTLVNSLTFGTNRSNNYNQSRAVSLNPDWDSTLGIANGFGPVFPGFEFNGSPFPGFGENDDAQDVDNTIAINDIVHWQRGVHSVKFGGEDQYHQYSFESKIGGTCSGNSGCFTFTDNQTASDTTYTGRDGNSFAAFVLGVGANANNLAQLHAPRWIAHYGALFAQDDWKVRPNLTLNLGLRWSYDTPRHEAEGDTAIMDETTPNPGANGRPGALVFAGIGPGRNGSKNETWASVYHKDFEPRVGFAWDPSFLDHKVVLRGSGGFYYGPLVYADYGQGTLQGFTVSQTLFTADPLAGVSVDAGLAVLPTSPDVDPTQLNGQGVDHVGETFGRPAKVGTWTLENQYQINPNLFFSLAYLGMHATRLHGLVDYPNDMPLSGLALGTNLFNVASGAQLPYADFQTTWGGNGNVSQALRPFPQYGYVNEDSYLQNVGQSSYDALTAKLEQRFHNGLNVLASYTFSKTLTDADAIQPYYSTLQNQGGTQNPYDHKAEKAVSNEDIPNNFVISYLYDLPVGKGKALLGRTPKPVNAVISNWRVSGVQRYLGGQPISFFGANGIPGFDNGIRPNRIPGQATIRSGAFNPFTFVNTGSGGYDHTSGACTTGYWNCAAFVDPNPTPGPNIPYVFGNMPRNSADIRGFAYYDEDLGINKAIPITERVHMDFRGELFDAFNRHAFNKPDSGVQDPSFGQVSSTLLGPRNIQFTLRVTY